MKNHNDKTIKRALAFALTAAVLLTLNGRTEDRNTAPFKTSDVYQEKSESLPKKR